jgi:hypothetical protein
MFRIIGHYEIDRDGDVIRVWSSPEFNLEAARQYARDMVEQIKQMPPCFGVLVNFDALPVIGPDVEASMRASARERAAMGMVAVAFVAASPDGLSVARVQWQRIYEGSGVAWRDFEADGPARAWLQAQVERAPS